QEFFKFLDDRGIKYVKHTDIVAINVDKSMDALGILNDAAGLYDSFEVIRGDMDDVFINVTGKKIRED
ncbi:MAG TPA: ABC transporter, partial [Clostridia bacterium]|nr:ABC transporter [Clostridia bacterium]